jgi:hypothetical protein
MHAYEYFLHYYVLIEEEQKMKKGMKERERERKRGVGDDGVVVHLNW